MKKLMATCLAGCVAALWSTQSIAVRLSLEPASQSVAPGAEFEVDVEISDLGNFVTPSLGAFLVEVNFDGDVLRFVDAEYGGFLGDPLDALETDILTDSDSGSATLDEISFLSDSELDALQPSSFTLATLVFEASEAGKSALAFGQIDLSDALGASITGVGLDAASVTVVPLPAGFVLLLSALGLLTVARARNRPEGRRRGAALRTQ